MEKNRMIKRTMLFILAIIIVGMFFISCSEDSATESQGNNNGNENLHENAVILDYQKKFNNLNTASINQVAPGKSDTLIFTGSAPVELIEGKTFLSTDTTGSEPICLLRAVDSVWIENDRTYMSTTQCGLGDVFEEYEFKSSAKIDLEGMVLDSTFQKSLIEQSKAKTLSVEEVKKGEKSLFKINLHQAVIQTIPVVITADIIVTLEDIDVELEAKWKDNDHYFDISTSVASSVEIITNCEMPSANIGIEWTIAKLPKPIWHIFWIPIGTGAVPIPYTVNPGIV